MCRKQRKDIEIWKVGASCGLSKVDRKVWNGPPRQELEEDCGGCFIWHWTTQSSKVFRSHCFIQLTYLRTWLSNIRHVLVPIFTYVPKLMYDHIRCTLHGSADFTLYSFVTTTEHFWFWIYNSHNLSRPCFIATIPLPFHKVTFYHACPFYSNETISW